MVRGKPMLRGRENGVRLLHFPMMRSYATESSPDFGSPHDIQRAKAAHEEETEFWIGVDYGRSGEEATQVRVAYSEDRAATRDDVEIVKAESIEDPPGRFRRVYLAVQSSLRELRDVIHWLCYGHR